MTKLKIVTRPKSNTVFFHIRLIKDYVESEFKLYGKVDMFQCLGVDGQKIIVSQRVKTGGQKMKDAFIFRPIGDQVDNIYVETDLTSVFGNHTELLTRVNEIIAIELKKRNKAIVIFWQDYNDRYPQVGA